MLLRLYMSATPPAFYTDLCLTCKRLSHDLKIVFPFFLHDYCELYIFWHWGLSMSIYIGTSYVETMQVLTSCSEVFLRLFLVLLLRDL